MKKKTFIKRIRDDPREIALWILGLTLVIVLIFSQINIEQAKNNCNLEIDLCKVISGTPAWIINGKIIGYGYKGNLSVDDLINNNIEFYYKDTCSYCKAQINDFNDWNKYQESGLTKQC